MLGVLDCGIFSFIHARNPTLVACDVCIQGTANHIPNAVMLKCNFDVNLSRLLTGLMKIFNLSGKSKIND